MLRAIGNPHVLAGSLQQPVHAQLPADVPRERPADNVNPLDCPASAGGVGDKLEPRVGLRREIGDRSVTAECLKPGLLTRDRVAIKDFQPGCGVASCVWWKSGRTQAPVAASYAAAVTGASTTSSGAGGLVSWRRRSCSKRTPTGVIVTPRQPRDARSKTAHTSDRQLVSPGSRPITLTRRRVSPKVRSMKLEWRIRRQCSRGKRRYVVRWQNPSFRHSTAAG